MLPPKFLSDEETLFPTDATICSPTQEKISKRLDDFKFMKQITHDTINYGFDCFYAAFVSLSGESMVIYSSKLSLYKFVLGPDTNEKVVDRAHTNQILSVRYFVENDKEYILTSSTNSVIRVWLMKDWSLIVNIDKVYEVDTSIYSALILFDNKDGKNNKFIVSSSGYDRTDFIKVWDFKGVYKFSLGELQSVYLMHVLYEETKDKKYLIVASRRNLISYDIDSKAVYKTYKRSVVTGNIDNYDFTIEKYNGEYALFATEKYGYINIFNFHTAECLKTLTLKYSGDDEIDGVTKWDDRYLIACHYRKSSLVVFDMNTKLITTSLYATNHSDPISCKKLYYPNYGPVIVAHYSNKFTTGSIVIFG